MLVSTNEGRREEAAVLRAAIDAGSVKPATPKSIEAAKRLEAAKLLEHIGGGRWRLVGMKERAVFECMRREAILPDLDFPAERYRFGRGGLADADELLRHFGDVAANLVHMVHTTLKTNNVKADMPTMLAISMALDVALLSWKAGLDVMRRTYAAEAN